MLEIGRGQFAFFCISGIQGRTPESFRYLSRLAEEYAQAYEFSWLLEAFYDDMQAPGRNPDLSDTNTESGRLRSISERLYLHPKSDLPADAS